MSPRFSSSEETKELLRVAAAAARDYSLATGVDCAVLNDAGDLLFDASIRRSRNAADFPRLPGEAAAGDASAFAAVAATSPAAETCLCLRMRRRKARGGDCRDLHLYASTQSERFGGSYVYLCPIGMHYWASPVYAAETIVGILVGGPVRAIEAEEVLAELMELHPGELSETEARLRIGAIPQGSTERIRALAELLTAAAARVSPVLAGSLDERLRILDQQSHIASAIHDIKASESVGEPIPPYPIAKERELLDAIRRNDETSARRVLNELLGAVFFASGHRFDLIKFRGLELMVLLSRAAAEAGAAVEEVLGLNYRFLKRFQELETQEDLAFCLDSVLSRFSRLAFSFRAVKHASAIEKALRFIKRRLTSGVSLQEAADAAGLSSTYFSRIFKDEMQESFSEYLNRLRVEKAASLLLGADTPLAEIAARVGFEDQSYFTKVFKRIKGISPGRFRTSGGRSVGENQELH